ncbi:MAG: flippase-like domain-containing protein [Anaerolineales bacterium]|nr:flippase-like domain-containing protein [Anaerolineales bacterium]
MKKRWIVFALTALFLWAVASRFTELKQLNQTLQQGQWDWILFALISQIFYFVVFAESYRAALKTAGVETRLRDLLPITLGALFVNLVVPAGIAGGTALFAQELSQKGKPAARVANGVLLQLIADFIAFTFVLAPGLIYLFYEHDLKVYEIAAAIFLLVLTVSLSAILAFGIWKPHWIQRLFAWTQNAAEKIFSRFKRRAPLADDWAQKNAAEFAQASQAVASHPLRLARTIATALLAHLFDIFTLYLLFRAFNQPVGFGTLIAGYAIGILFWIVSITPQGVGVVEGMMTLTFASLGVSGAAAATIVLAFRGLTFWIPMALGFFAVQRTRIFAPPRRALTEVWGVRFAALFVAAMGAVNVLSAVTPSLTERFRFVESYLPLDVLRGGHLTAALSGFALLILANNLARRKRVAWALTLIALTFSIVSHLIKGLDYEEATLAGVLMVVLIVMRDHFHARSDAPSLRQGLRVLVGAALFTLMYGALGFWLLDKHYSVNFSFADALRQTAAMFAQFYDPGLEPVTRFARFFANSIYIIGAATFAYAGWMILRPVFFRQPATADERNRAREIVVQYGKTSLARLTLMDDKRYFFTSGGSVVAYALSGRSAIALGDPIGPAEDLSAAVREFCDLCRRNDWMPIFYQILPETISTYAANQFDVLSIGQEGIVDLKTFSLEGKDGKPLRSPINKLKKANFEFSVYEPPISDDLLNQLREISDEWLTFMHGSEKRFSLGWFDDDYIRNSPIAVVRAPDGGISAFANFIPEYQNNGITIDLMRRRQEIENGVMEFLFVSMFQWAQSKGYDTFDLGLSALSGVGEKKDDPALERTMRFIYENVNQFYNFKGLHSFKEKFHPQWTPRYIAYPGAVNLAPAWVAVIQVSSGESALPRWLRKRVKLSG